MGEFERVSTNTRTDDPFAAVGAPTAYEVAIFSTLSTTNTASVLKDGLTDKGQTADYDDQRKTMIQILVPETGTNGGLGQPVLFRSVCLSRGGGKGAEAKNNPGRTVK